MNPGFVTDILVTLSSRFLLSSDAMIFPMSIGDFFRSFASNSAIFEERSPKSLFFGGARE